MNVNEVLNFASLFLFPKFSATFLVYLKFSCKDFINLESEARVEIQ